ncbi:MAG TPA: flagellar export chaperone FlgN, partial [Nocardioides sp.]|nr:flagellar export chaperone FlgN [Nocardioides sp.]
MERLSQVLWRERELLEELLFRLEVEQLVLASGRNRWLPAAAADVERLLHDLRRTEVMRAAAADHAA